jgi:glycosyltransferase involved in cell wall biosynthesis
MNWSTISIITVVYNDFTHIENTIQSCINQTYTDTEFIIIDSGSNHGTLEMINKYKTQINVIISKKNNGIYDAMNKGIENTTSQWIIFINSGDGFYNNTVLSDIFNTEHNTDLIYGKNQSTHTLKNKFSTSNIQN